MNVTTLTLTNLDLCDLDFFVLVRCPSDSSLHNVSVDMRRCCCLGHINTFIDVHSSLHIRSLCRPVLKSYHKQMRRLETRLKDRKKAVGAGAPGH